MGAFGQPGLNPGYGSKRRQAVLQSQGQLDPFGNRVRQAMQPAQGFAVYSQQAPQQQAPQQQAPQQQAPQQQVASGGGFGAYAPQPAAQPAPRPVTMGSAQPIAAPSQGTPISQTWTTPADPEGYKRFMQARSAEYKALRAEGNRAALDRFVTQPQDGSESMTEEQLRAAVASYAARRRAADSASYARYTRTPEYRARAAQTQAREEADRQARQRQHEEYWSPENQARLRREADAKAKLMDDQRYREQVSRIGQLGVTSQAPDSWIRMEHELMAARPDLYPDIDILGLDVDRLWLPPEYQRNINQREGSLYSSTAKRLPTARPGRGLYGT